MSCWNAVGVAEGVADAAGEQRVAGEQVRVAVGVVVEQRDRAGGVAGERDRPRAMQSPTGTVSPSPTARSTATPVCSVIASASGAPATVVRAGARRRRRRAPGGGPSAGGW